MSAGLRTNYSDGGAAASPTTVVAADMNAISGAVNSLFPSSTSQASSATTLTLTATSDPVQIITGTTQAQTVALPTTLVAAGDQWMVVNSMTTAAVTVNASGGATVATIGPGAAAVFTATAATPTTAAGWLTQYAGTVVAAGKVLSVNNTITLAGTDGTTMTFPTGSDTVVGVAATQTLTSKKLSLAAGAAAAAGAPLYLASGTSLTTPAAGAVEYDGTVFYQTPSANNRHVNDGEQFITLTAAYTLANQTAAQKLFNSPTNGAVTLAVGTYFFECMFSVSGMAAVSGGYGFALGGTATIAGQMWFSEANKSGANVTASAPNTTMNTAANTLITPANALTTGYARIYGKVRISAAGTLIPQFSIQSANATTVIGVDSYFRIWPVGSATVTNVGNWS